MKRTRFNEYFTATNAEEDYSSGDLVLTDGVTFNFWGKVDLLKSPTSFSEGKRLENHVIKIECRTRDVVNVNIGTEITTDSGEVFTVEDKYSVDFKFTDEIIASRIGN